MSSTVTDVCVCVQVVVLVAACCVHWLAIHTACSPDPQHSTAEAVLHVSP